MVKYLGSGGNMAFIRGCHWLEYGGKKDRVFWRSDCLATTLGPSPAEAANTGSGAAYPESLQDRAASPGAHFWALSSFYRDGPGTKRWTKSLELIADLYALETQASESSSPARRRSSSSASSALFPPQLKGVMHAPVTVLWGEKDPSCRRPMFLDGMGDYITKDSEIVVLPRSGHWTPVETESRQALAHVVALYAAGEEGSKASITDYVQEVYEGAVQMAKR
jgi:pimeloyl-ACP methyl ester carboxylesterase